MRYLLLALVLVTMSCEQIVTNPSLDGHWPTNRLVRVRVLDNRRVTYCILDSFQLRTLRYGDTVWLDLGKHAIDDVGLGAVKSIILR